MPAENLPASNEPHVLHVLHVPHVPHVPHVQSPRLKLPQPSLEAAQLLDSTDPLASIRTQFHYPFPVYLCGNSLGLMPTRTQNALQSHLSKWKTLAVEGHFEQPQPWVSIEKQASILSMPIVGAKFQHEVAVMNSLTVNLHLMLVSFYRPTKERSKILLEQHAFSSDEYALQTHLQSRNIDPQQHLIRLSPRPEEFLLRDHDIIAAIHENSQSLALILLPGIQYYTGQFFDIPAIVAVARSYGIPVGLDLAHAVGNVPLQLHDWDVDFAVWCTYKYLNSGPGAVAGVFIHDRHSKANLPRYGGWWGHDANTRFGMPLEFSPQPGAWGYQISNPPVLSLVPIIESLRLIQEAGGVGRMREKSIRLTCFLETCLDRLKDVVEVISPSQVDRRGCQLSLRVIGKRIKEVNEGLGKLGVVCDVREPDVLRVAPVPLYNSFMDVWKFVEALEKVLKEC